MKEWIITILFTVSSSVGFGQIFRIPEKYDVVMEAYGDLDKDGVPERMVVCNTDIPDENPRLGVIRTLYILKKAKSGEDVVWKENSNLLWISKECGFCIEDTKGDPLLYLEIINNTFIVKQKRYNNTRRVEELKQVFRFQDNDWYLIGSTYRYADNCDFDVRHDINFSTNIVEVTNISHDCDEHENQKESYSKKKYSYKFPKVKMDDYKPTEVIIKKGLSVWF